MEHHVVTSSMPASRHHACARPREGLCAPAIAYKEPRISAGTIGASVMAPWVRSLEKRGGRVHARHRMRDLRLDAVGAATAVLADAPDGPCVRKRS